MRDIATATGLGLTSVHRVISQYRAALDRADADDPGFDPELDAELGGLVGRLTPTSACEDVRSRADFDQLKQLEKFRRAHLPPDHPAWAI